jgi:hypothetical protein
MVDAACEAFRNNAIGTKLTQTEALLLELKTDYNAHSHTAAGSLTSHATTSDAVDAISNLLQLQVCCPALESINGFFGDVRDIVNGLRTQYNAHSHTFANTATTAVVTQSALVFGDDKIEDVGRQCPALGVQGAVGTMGQHLKTIVTLTNDLKAMYDAHTHPTALTNTSNSTVTAAAVGTLYY